MAMDTRRVCARAEWFEAAETGNIPRLKLCITSGLKPDVQDQEGWNALHYAAFKGREKAALFLVKLLAIELDSTSKKGRTVLHMTSIRGNTAITGAILTRMKKEGIEHLPDKQDNHNATALHYAADRGDIQTCSLLLDARAKPNIVDARGRTPLFYATMCANLTLVELLHSHGADVNVQDREKKTPLFVAIARGKIKTAGLLIEKGADTDVFDKYGKQATEYSPTRAFNAQITSVAERAKQNWAIQKKINEEQEIARQREMLQNKRPEWDDCTEIR